ncbi:hypothetical protein U1Q18_011387 [Sarracenia purpurea var. burkii]
MSKIEVDKNFDPSSHCRESKSSSAAASCSFRTESSQTHTDLSLALPESALDGRGPCRTGGGADPELRGNPHRSQIHHIHHPTSPLKHLNHGFSSLDVSDRLRPIRGIPVYHNRTLPFYQMPYSPWSSSLSPSSPSSSSLSSLCPSPVTHSPVSSPYFGTSLDSASILNSAGPKPNASPSAYWISGGARFNGYQLPHQHSNHYGVGPPHGGSHGMMGSRFMPKLPTRRSTRAPRMRWTNSLHARFVHAVELLGGHESMDLLLFP